MRDFKVGDKVKVEFEGVVDDIKNGHAEINKRFYPCKNLTLLEPAKPNLEVGQVWKETHNDWLRRKILMITETTVFYSCDEYRIDYSCEIEQFIKDYAHKLISEDDNE
jgi:hypothetical protein